MVRITTFTVSLYHLGCSCQVTGFDIDLPFTEDEALIHARRLVADHYDSALTVSRVTPA